MAFDDLVWKIWEFEEEIRKKQQEEEELRRRLRGLMSGLEGRIKQSASPHMMNTHGITSYDLSFRKDQFEFKVIDNSGDVLIRAAWKRDMEKRENNHEVDNLSIIMEKLSPIIKLEVQCNPLKSKITQNGNRLSLNDFEKSEATDLVSEYHVFFQDFLVEVVRDMQQQQTTKAGGGNRGSSSQKMALQTIKDISCVCSSFGWIGLAICGPTCLGTIIAQAVDP